MFGSEIMNDLKEFWTKVWKTRTTPNFSGEYDVAFNNGYQMAWNEIKDKQGLFFWERGGKEFAESRKIYWKEQKTNVTEFDYIRIKASVYFDMVGNARDFLDALACLGEEKVKELIGELQ